MRRASRTGPRGRSFVNLTPMIDVVFQLIIFFMLVAQFSSQQAIDLVLPSLTESGADLLDSEGRAVINVVPAPSTALEGGSYRLGTLAFDGSPDGVRRLSSTLGDLLRRDPQVRVLVRADRTEAYERVHPALQAATLAGAQDVDLVVSSLSVGEATR